MGLPPDVVVNDELDNLLSGCDLNVVDDEGSRADDEIQSSRFQSS
jgi:hypothetical protein